LISAIHHQVDDVLENDVPLEVAKFNTTLGVKPAKWGGYCLKVQHLPALTKRAWHKLRESQFRFDVELFNSKEGKLFNKSLNMNEHQKQALIHSLSSVLITSNPQYHDSFYIQNSGRLHTKGGVMNMSSAFRRHYIRPVNPSNHVIEVDLKCAQLLALCDLLGAEDTRQEIIGITRNESIWDYIGNASIPKELKKVIVCGFCFGASVSDLPYLATYRGSIKHNYQQSITKGDVEDCFSGVLHPLLELRDVWMSKYSISNITSGNVDKVIHTNAMGMKFNLNSELTTYKTEVKSTKRRLNDLKIASRLLAFFAQGTGQLVAQSLLDSSYVSNNLITYSYDGFSLETAQLQEYIHTYTHCL